MPQLNHALIVDDDALNLEVLARLLDSAKITHTAIQDPAKLASVIASADQVDIVFLDLEMPHMDSYQAFALIHNMLGADVPVVACTAYTNQARTVRELGFFGFISKPIDRSRFSDQLVRISRGEQVWDYR